MRTPAEVVPVQATTAEGRPGLAHDSQAAAVATGACASQPRSARSVPYGVRSTATGSSSVASSVADAEAKPHAVVVDPAPPEVPNTSTGGRSTRRNACVATPRTGTGSV